MSAIGIDRDINDFSGRVVAFHTIVTGASALFATIDKSPDNVQQLSETVSSWVESVGALKPLLAAATVDKKTNLPLCRKIKKVHDDVKCLDKLLGEKETGLRENLAAKNLVANMETLHFAIDDVDKTLDETPKSFPLKSPVPNKKVSVQATRLARSLALRDALFGCVAAFVKEVGAIAFKAVFLYSSYLLEAYLRLGFWNGSKATTEISILLAIKTVSAFCKSASRLPFNVARAFIGVISPKVWVKVVQEKDENVKPFFPLKTVSTALYGVLSPCDGHVFGYQKNGDKKVLVEYTTRLEKEVKMVSKHWFNFNERASRLIASHE